ncbi:hypothetical protein E2C01_011200 [Portunus trituberculatus]|uniref:Uncharacterized protein n=1 Tax=Portunus trituberculatus TaxID=210409 RepID=A0A5B7DAH0_PORTR|nr:hypothetical protein [Portunus trituberculatus]
MTIVTIVSDKEGVGVEKSHYEVVGCKVVRCRCVVQVQVLACESVVAAGEFPRDGGTGGGGGRRAAGSGGEGEGRAGGRVKVAVLYHLSTPASLTWRRDSALDWRHRLDFLMLGDACVDESNETPPRDY